MGECEDCTPDKILNVDDFDGKKDERFFKWYRENKNMDKIEMTVKYGEAIETWTSPVVNMKEHIHRKRIQVFCLNNIEKDLKSTDIFLHADFSESYKTSN